MLFRSQLIDLFATDSRHLVHISTTFRSRSPPILDAIPPFLPLLSASFCQCLLFSEFTVQYIYICSSYWTKERQVFPLSLSRCSLSSLQVLAAPLSLLFGSLIVSVILGTGSLIIFIALVVQSLSSFLSSRPLSVLFSILFPPLVLVSCCLPDPSVVDSSDSFVSPLGSFVPSTFSMFSSPSL